MAGLDRNPRPVKEARENASPSHNDGGESSGAATAGSSDGGSFDCNICLELAQDPVVTLCGHLFCWPCLYRWLNSRILAKDCPVCKASVEEEKVIPLYGRGKVGFVDPRTKAVPGVDIPQRPAGQRPETVRSPGQQYPPFGFGFMAGPAIPAASARFGNVTLSAGYGLFPSLFGFHVQGYSGSAGFGASPSFPFGAPSESQSNQFQSASPSTHEQQQEVVLSRLLVFLGCFVVFCLLFF